MEITTLKNRHNWFSHSSLVTIHGGEDLCSEAKRYGTERDSESMMLKHHDENFREL